MTLPKFLLLIFLIILSSCGENLKKSYYFKSGELLSEIEYNEEGQKDGQLKEYYKTGELKTIESYKNGKLIDTTFGYDKSGNLTVKRYADNGIEMFEGYENKGSLRSKGVIFDTILTGWWEYYDKDGKLEQKIEYLNASEDSLLKNKQHINQVIRYDQDQKVIKDSSNYLTIELKDTISMGELTLGYLDLVPGQSKESDFHMVYFYHEDSSGNRSPMDSTYGKNNKKATIWITPIIEGNYYLKGHIIEKGTKVVINKEDSEMRDIYTSTTKMFFKKPYFVINSSKKN